VRSSARPVCFGGFLSGGQIEVASDLADDVTGLPAIRSVTGKVSEIAHLDERFVNAPRRRRRRQAQAKFSQAIGDSVHAEMLRG